MRPDLLHSRLAPRVAALVSLAAALMVAAAVTAPAARADDDCRYRSITPAAAVAIAASVGLVVVKEIECDDDAWEVEGWNVVGLEMEVEIDARTGRIIEVEFDD
ncbi:MAG: PepSY domain-containing protein [Acetobacteraceae bacterium]|nr:PepSY domain-containing protein [Acetobacteraceae bacterium]